MRITVDADHKLVGTFRTALGDSAFAGDEARIVGIHQGDRVHFA